MDWTELGLQDSVIAWLEDAASSRYAQDRRLDPFATSMRDFDDASAHLKAIRAGNPPAMTDARQRITDLKNAGLVVAGGEAVTDLGAAVLDAWEKYGVDSEAKSDELARLLLMALEARRIGDADFSAFFEYWSDLRSHFDALELIDNWDALYQINYLDFDRDGFFPGSAYRDLNIAVSDIEFDLADYVRNVGASAEAIDGADRIQNAIGGKLPRGRHRATFCMALEIVISGGASAPAILGSFGFPKKPGIWVPFDDEQKAKIIEILADYESVASEVGDNTEAADDAKAETGLTVEEAEKPAPTLPDNIDYSSVLSDPPKPTSKNDGGGGSGPKKIDHQKKAKTSDAIGKLGEQFAMEFEKWRLREHPDLQDKIKQVSKEDDTLGYDIESFETDGTPRFVEVKGTVGPMEKRFFLSATELACAQSKGEQYVILRVSQLADDPKCCEVRYPFDGKLDLTPVSYGVTFCVSDEAGG